MQTLVLWIFHEREIPQRSLVSGNFILVCGFIAPGLDCYGIGKKATDRMRVGGEGEKKLTVSVERLSCKVDEW